jgi:pyruvate dehydrogenase E2 component (dihydrolipoamide acetyltransferase)
MAKVEVVMPKMGESITEGTVLTWHKKPGDQIEVDETLLEIGTDKVDSDVPSPAAGVLAQILVQENETVDVGTILALIETEAEAEVSATPAPAPPTAAAAPEPEPKPAAQPQPAPAPAPQPVAAPSAPAAASGKTVDVVMPKMGESIVEGTIISWHKKPGEPVELDETLLEIATDKVDTEVPSPAAGVLQEILFKDGDTVEVGTRIAVIATEAEAGTAPAQPQPSAPAPVKETAPAREEAARPSGDGAVREPQMEEAGTIPRKTPDGKFFSPLVRSIAEKEGLSVAELSSIEGSGREGRITKQDLLKYIEGRKQQPRTPAPQSDRPAAPARPLRVPSPEPASETDYDGRVEIIEMDRMRQIIATHMVHSKATSAHVTSFAEADVTNLVRLRDLNKDAFLKREGIKLTFTPFFIQAAIEALREHPFFNASVEGTRILVKKDFHIGLAVAIGKKGLIAPIIRNAGDKNLVGIARSAADLAERARNKQLQPDELQGGTFTITNIGSLGSIMGTPIINQPQVAILATGAIKKRPVVVEDPALGDLIAIRHMMYLSLSYDHRIIDGAMGASFLQKFVQVVESIDPKGEV